MTDPFEATFGDLDERYPGSKRPRRERPAPRTVVETDWDQRPKRLVVKGVEYEFFTIGALAKAINRRPVTIRAWETAGVIPKARYRTAEGRRLYSRRQIEGLIELCDHHGILDFQARPDRIPPEFTADVIELWKEDLT